MKMQMIYETNEEVICIAPRFFLQKMIVRSMTATCGEICCSVSLTKESTSAISIPTESLLPYIPRYQNMRNIVIGDHVNYMRKDGQAGAVDCEVEEILFQEEDKPIIYVISERLFPKVKIKATIAEIQLTAEVSVPTSCPPIAVTIPKGILFHAEYLKTGEENNEND